MTEIKGYRVVEIRTGITLKEYTKDQRKYADRYADKKDLEYGAICVRVDWIL